MGKWKGDGFVVSYLGETENPPLFAIIAIVINFSLLNGVGKKKERNI